MQRPARVDSGCLKLTAIGSWEKIACRLLQRDKTRAVGFCRFTRAFSRATVRAADGLREAGGNFPSAVTLPIRFLEKYLVRDLECH